MLQVVLLTLLYNAISSLPTRSLCSLKLESSTATGGRVIEVTCDGDMLVSLSIEEDSQFSHLRVTGDTLEHHREFIAVEYYKSSQDMFIIIDGVQYNVKDSKKAEESEKLKELLDDPEFSFFPTAVRLIHDELQLKGWESPAVMFLYRLGMAAESYHVELAKREVGFQLGSVDPTTYEYHGSTPAKECKLNGWAKSDISALVADNCRGVCGQVCSDCWMWVCGDCCLHIGCKRHDLFCDEMGYLSMDCLSARGVMWDTITGTHYDC